MKITVRQLRRVISEEVKRVFEAANTVKDALSDDLALVVVAGDPKSFILYDPELLIKIIEADEDDSRAYKAIYAVVMVNRDKEASQWGAKTVNATAARDGYGPLLYDIAMDECGGLVSDRSSVSPRAKAVWRYYKDNREDVVKKPLDDMEDPKSPPKVDDTEELHPGGAKNPLNYAYFINRGPKTARLKANHAAYAKQFRRLGITQDRMSWIAQEFFDRNY